MKEPAATTFTSTTGGQTTNELANGSTFTIVLAADGTTTGELFIPNGNEDGSDFTASLAGSWTLSGSTVDFNHAADTFVRDMTFTVSGSTLVGDSNFGVTRVQVTLTKQ